MRQEKHKDNTSQKTKLIWKRKFIHVDNHDTNDAALTRVQSFYWNNIYHHISTPKLITCKIWIKSTQGMFAYKKYYIIYFNCREAYAGLTLRMFAG